MNSRQKPLWTSRLYFCENAIEIQSIDHVEVQDTLLFRISLKELPDNLESLRGNSGYFYEHQTEDINSVANIVTPTYQTLTYAGLDKEELKSFVMQNQLTGIDRIVPVGSALDMSIIWDGHNVIESLTRTIDIR